MREELPVWPSLDVVAYHVERQLDLQWQQWDLMDGRLRMMLGFAGAAFAASLAFFGSGNDLSGPSLALVVVVALWLCLSAAIATVAFLPREFQRPPEPRFLRENYLVVGEADTKRDVIDTMVDAYEMNAEKIREKSLMFLYSVVAFAIGVILAGAAALLELLY